MKAIEFETQVGPDRTLTIPPSVMAAIPIGQPVRVLILIPEADIDQEWERLAAEDFGQGYSETDAVYDQLSTG